MLVKSMIYAFILVVLLITGWTYFQCKTKEILKWGILLSIFSGLLAVLTLNDVKTSTFLQGFTWQEIVAIVCLYIAVWTLFQCIILRNAKQRGHWRKPVLKNSKHWQKLTPKNRNPSLAIKCTDVLTPIAEWSLQCIPPVRCRAQ